MVVTAVGDVADLVRRGGFGLLASDRPDDLARQVLTLLRDPARRELMGRRARQIVLENYLPERIVPQYEKVYQEALNAL